jgi:hypothetical protein
LSHKEVFGLFLNVARTIHISIEIIYLCEMEADDVTPSMPYSLRLNWRDITTKRIVEDILYDHPHKAALTAILVTHDEFTLMYQDKNSEDNNYSRQSTFFHLMLSTITSNGTFRVMVQRLSKAMKTLKLQYRHNMAILNQLRYPAPQSHVGQSNTVLALPPALNKLDIHQDLELKQFRATDIQPLSRL